LRAVAAPPPESGGKTVTPPLNPEDGLELSSDYGVPRKVFPPPKTASVGGTWYGRLPAVIRTRSQIGKGKFEEPLPTVC